MKPILEFFEIFTGILLEISIKIDCDGPKLKILCEKDVVYIEKRAVFKFHTCYKVESLKLGTIVPVGKLKMKLETIT